METTEIKTSKMWNIFLWIAQVFLAIMFFMSGFAKITTPIPELSKVVNWVVDVPEGLVRFIGVSEFTGAIGLLLPSLLKIKPILTPWAAVGFLTIMVLAMFFHFSRGEYQALPINLFFGSIALFIAWGRFKKVPIEARDRIGK